MCGRIRVRAGNTEGGSVLVRVMENIRGLLKEGRRDRGHGGHGGRSSRGGHGPTDETDRSTPVRIPSFDF